MIPTLTLTRPPLAPTYNRHAAAAQLSLTYEQFTKLLSAGLISEPLQRESIDDLADRKWVEARSGELTILRADAVNIEHSDDQLAESLLGGWRSSPERIIGNELLVATLVTIPVAVFQITAVADTIRETPITDTATITSTNTEALKPRVYHDVRHRYEGKLLARVRLPGSVYAENDNSILDGVVGDHSPFLVTGTTDLPADHEMMQAARTIMSGRVKVTSHGSIAYLRQSK